MSDLEEAEAWLSSARYLLQTEAGRRSWRTVAVAQSIHSMIKTNDALTFRFLGRRASRHEDSAALLKELARRHLIPKKYADRREAFALALREKSEYDYGGAEIGRIEAERRVRRAEVFLAAVRDILAAHET